MTKEERWVLEEKYSGIMIPEALRDFERLAKGEPVDYVIGFVRFLDCHVDLSQKPFIPRVETEEWVGNAIDALRGVDALSCADLFSGSGCIGIAVAKHLEGAKMDFMEQEERFREQIRINAERNEISPERYAVYAPEAFQKSGKKYDVIFANPPYLSSSSMEFLDSSVRDWEPKTALFGGSEDGLGYIRELFAKAPSLLRSKGVVYVEFDDEQKDMVEEIATKSGFSCEFSKDAYGFWRVGKARLL